MLEGEGEGEGKNKLREGEGEGKNKLREGEGEGEGKSSNYGAFRFSCGVSSDDFEFVAIRMSP